MKQKNIFLREEGNAWFDRNEIALANRSMPNDDPVLMELLAFDHVATGGLKVLEIGCGDGARLSWLKENFHAECHGIDPSDRAVAAARSKGIHAQQGTADKLPFDDQSFDIVIFGFCLYLCDREDLFRIASEADRVMRTPGWLAIMDFFSPTPRSRNYHHHVGVKSYKMDYRTLFNWHPDYECLTHKIVQHGVAGYTDNPEEWVSISVLRKFTRPPDA